MARLQKEENPETNVEEVVEESPVAQQAPVEKKPQLSKEAAEIFEALKNLSNHYATLSPPHAFISGHQYNAQKVIAKYE